MTKTHFYPGNSPRTQKGYHETACGRDGYNVGGLIEYFFKMIRRGERCKTCNRIYRKRGNND